MVGVVLIKLVILSDPYGFEMTVVKAQAKGDRHRPKETGTGQRSPRQQRLQRKRRLDVNGINDEPVHTGFFIFDPISR